MVAPERPPEVLRPGGLRAAWIREARPRLAHPSATESVTSDAVCYIIPPVNAEEIVSRGERVLLELTGLHIQHQGSEVLLSFMGKQGVQSHVDPFSFMAAFTRGWLEAFSAQLPSLTRIKRTLVLSLRPPADGEGGPAKLAFPGSFP